MAIGSLCHLADDGQHGAFDRLAYRAVRGITGRSQRARQHVAVDLAALSQHIGEPGHDLGQDDPAVSTRPSQRRALGHRRHFLPRRPCILLQSIRHPDRGAPQVGAGVAVGNRVHVQVVQARPAGLERRRAAAGRGQGDLARGVHCPSVTECALPLGCRSGSSRLASASASPPDTERGSGRCRQPRPDSVRTPPRCTARSQDPPARGER